MIKLKRALILIFTILCISKASFSQFSCIPATSSFNFTPTPLSQNKFINWDAFPEFSLPFKIVFGGPRFGDTKQQPLKHGFSHLSSYSGPDSVSLPVKNRALVYYGVAFNFPDPQPWQLIRSPWANNMPGYYKKWRGEMAAYAYHFWDTIGTRSPAADMLILDVERHWEGQFTLATDLAILGIKKDALVPAHYQNLSDNQFVVRYKRDMLNLYAEPIRYMRNDGLLDKFRTFSSYGDVPIKYQSLNIEGNQWADWQSNTERLSYLMKDTLTNKLGGDFYNQLDFICPSVYLQADYGANPKARGGNYLAEMLFQIEVNKAWSKKDIIPFVWLRYEDFSLPYPRFVKPFQAEALAIFPFFAGAKGTVLWDDSYQALDNTNFTTYEYYLNGLYKLSLYKSFFEGNYELVQAVNARDLFTNQLPVWRGIVKDGKILIAASNPYAADNQETKLEVAYKNWKNTIVLKGKEVFLCAYNLVDITANEPQNILSQNVKILSNPTLNSEIKIQLDLENPLTATFEVITAEGRSAVKQKKILTKGENIVKLPLEENYKGLLYLKIMADGNILTCKIINQ